MYINKYNEDENKDNYKSTVNYCKYNTSTLYWRNSVYNYNFNKLNITIHEKNKNIYLLLNSYFNSKNKNWKEKGIIKKNTLNKFYINLYLKRYKYINILYKFFTFKYLIVLFKGFLIKNPLKEVNYIDSINKQGDSFKNINRDRNKKLFYFYRKKIKNNKFKSIYSLKKIFINMPYIKHTNNFISLLVMVFNKKKSYLLNKLMKIKMKIYQMKNNKNYNENIIKNKIIQFNEHNISEFNSNLSINFFETKILESINLINLKKFSIIRLKKQKKFNTKFRYYLALLYLNSYKFNNLNLINLKKIIHKVYNKNIKLNIINIKYSYLDSTIFTQTIMKKLNDRKKNILGVLKKTFKLVKLAKLNDNLIKNNLNTIKYKINNLTKHREFIDKYFINKKELILNKIKYLHIIGLFMEAKGRLTKRMTASRSVWKFKQKGNLKNLYETYGFSGNYLRGVMKSNIDSIKNNSKNVNGSYGISSRMNIF
jgi:hypothetical protein